MKDWEPTAGHDPEMIYEKRWATRLFDRLKGFLTEEPQTGEYEILATELGITRNTVAVAVHRLRQRYGELLQIEIVHDCYSWIHWFTHQYDRAIELARKALDLGPDYLQVCMFFGAEVNAASPLLELSSVQDDFLPA